MEDPRLMLHEKAVEYARIQFQTSERALRTWFIAYAIGVPAILISSDTMCAKLMEPGVLRDGALLCFFAAVYIQICTEIVSKAVNRRLLHQAMQAQPRPQLPAKYMRKRVARILQLDFATFMVLLVGTVSMFIHLISGGQAAAGEATTMPALP